MSSLQVSEPKEFRTRIQTLQAWLDKEVDDLEAAGKLLRALPAAEIAERFAAFNQKTIDMAKLEDPLSMVTEIKTPRLRGRFFSLEEAGWIAYYSLKPETLVAIFFTDSSTVDDQQLLRRLEEVMANDHESRSR